MWSSSTPLHRSLIGNYARRTTVLPANCVFWSPNARYRFDVTNGCGDTGAREKPAQNQIIPGDPQITPVQSPPPASTQDWIGISKDPPHADLRSTARCLNERVICNLNHGFGTNVSSPPSSIGRQPLATVRSVGALWPKPHPPWFRIHLFASPSYVKFLALTERPVGVRRA